MNNEEIFTVPVDGPIRSKRRKKDALPRNEIALTSRICVCDYDAERLFLGQLSRRNHVMDIQTTFLRFFHNEWILFSAYRLVKIRRINSVFQKYRFDVVYTSATFASSHWKRERAAKRCCKHRWWKNQAIRLAPKHMMEPENRMLTPTHSRHCSLISSRLMWIALEMNW